VVLRDGRFSVDLRIDAPHPRDRTAPEFLEHRRMLLTELGVDLHRQPSNSSTRGHR